MAGKKTPKPDARTDEYLHQKVTRTNNPESGLHSADKVKVPPKVKYQYDPHLDPQLVWASKAERTEIEVDTISLHKHEIIRPQDIVSLVQDEPVQLGLFGDQRLPITKAVEFYRHDQLWMNRMVLGDSLLVMNSLLHKENLGGHVQMIYIDPPYGVEYNSNFQPRTDKREVKDGKDDSLSREPEQIKAYRDTWTLGVHSYLSYMRDRLMLSRALLSESGSIFVQINDENVHRVRAVADEVLGSENFVVTIVLKKKGATVSTEPVNDFILWYAKDRSKLKVRELYVKRGQPEDDNRYNTLIGPNGEMVRITKLTDIELDGYVGSGYEYARVNYPIVSQDESERSKDFVWNGKKFSCGKGKHWRYDPDTQMRILAEQGRLFDGGGKSLGGVVRWSDWPYVTRTNIWDDLHGDQEPIYVVQTNRKVIARCLLMTTDPGDLVLDPTCGSGTTAFVAEQWGRRWITCDTSRIALALARQRLMTSTFPFYELAYPREGVAGGFRYEEVRRVSLGSIALQSGAKMEKLLDRPIESKHVSRVSGPFSVEAIAALDPSEAATPAPSVVDAIPSRSADRVQQLFDVLAKDGGLSLPGTGRIEIEGLHRVMDLDGIDAEGEITISGKKLRLAVAFGPYHGPVTANRLEEAIGAATGQYQALAVAGFSFDPEVSAFLDKHPMLSVQLFRVQIAPDVQIGDLLKVKHAEKLFSVLGQPDFDVAKDGAKYTVTIKGVDLYDPNTRLVKAHQLDDVAAWFLDPDYDGRCFRVRQVFLPAEQGKGFEKLQKSLKSIIDEDAWDALKGFTSMPFELGSFKTVAVKVINVFGHEVIGVRKVKG